MQLRDISKQFPGVRALNRVSLDLEAGEVHALLGENGAGKSTLIKILSGAYAKDEGKVIISGQEVEISGPKDALNLGISVIYQELNLVPYLTVAENISLGREPLRGRGGLLNGKAMVGTARAALEFIDADINPQAVVANLSIAQRQMVEIAKAVSREARVLVMDEPTSSLTEGETAKLFRVIATLKKRGVGIIYISHRMDEIFAIADRVTVLRDGENVGTRQISEVTRDELVAMMVARKLSDYYAREHVEASNVILEIRHLNAGKLLRDISLTVRRGEVVGVAGLVGSGRTELARCIFGIDRYDSGEIIIEGRPVRVSSPQEAIRLGIALVPEDRKKSGLVLKMAVRENLSMPAMNSSRRSDPLLAWGQFIRRRAEMGLVADFIRQLDIKTPSDTQNIGKLSGGNQQKVVLAKWLAISPKLLILDEPTRGIDVGAKAEVYSLINECTKRGMGILMISSELPEILGMSDRILVMGGGRIRGELAGKEASQEKIMGLAI